jgi:hypothetical protein
LLSEDRIIRISTRAIGIFVSTAVLAGCMGHASVIPAQTQAGSDRRDPIFLTLPSQHVDFASLDAQRDASETIPFYSGTIRSPLDHVDYSYRIVGSDPTKSDTTTDVLYKPIALKVHFADGTVLDPMKPACGDTVSVSDRFFRGPNFARVALTSNGVSVGDVQLTDGFQRAEFWEVLKGPHYHTVLKAAGAPMVVDITAPDDSIVRDGVCAGPDHKVGGVDVDWMERTVVSLAKTLAKTNEIALFLTYNVFGTSGGRCCISGFHDAFGTADGTQVYGIGAYNDSGTLRHAVETDINVLTHELGDILNDPFPLPDREINIVPPWGGIGQVPKGACQNTLETGDPLTGTAFEVRYDGFTYHPQDLAFFSWFYRTRSIGTGEAYSFAGTLKDTQGLCISE